MRSIKMGQLLRLCPILICNTSRVFFFHFRLNVYFRDVVVIENSQYPKTEWPDLFSALGGLMGLWAGLSVMTVTEFIFLACNVIISLLGKIAE